MKNGLLIALGFLAVACAPAANPFDVHPAKLGQRWNLEAQDARTKLSLKTVLNLNGERSTQGDTLLVTGEASGSPAAIAYDPKQNTMFAFAVLKAETTLSKSTVAYCFVLDPADTKAKKYSGLALIDTLENISAGKSNVGNAKPNSCRFSLQESAARAPTRSVDALEMRQLLEVGMKLR
jgi:hypothetical protein